MVRFPTKVSFVADEDEDIEMIASVFRDSRFETAIREALRSIVTPAETAEVVRDLLLSWVVSIEDAWNALVKYHNSLPPESPVGHGLRQVFDNWSIEWLFEHHDSEITWPKAAYRNCSFSQRKFGNSSIPTALWVSDARHLFLDPCVEKPSLSIFALAHDVMAISSSGLNALAGQTVCS